MLQCGTAVCIVGALQPNSDANIEVVSNPLQLLYFAFSTLSEALLAVNPFLNDCPRTEYRQS